MRKLSLFCLLLAAPLLALVVPLPLPGALADTTTGETMTGTNGLGITKADFHAFRFQYQNDKKEWVDMNKTTLETYFNRGNCECNRPIRVIITLQGNAVSKLPVGKMGFFQLRAGDNTCVCQTETACMNRLCKDLTMVQDQGVLAKNGLTFETTVRDLFAAGRSTTDTSGVCDRDGPQNIYLWGDSEDIGTFSDLQDVAQEIRLDGLGPAAPTGLKVVGGNEALEVSWDRPASVTDDQGYQVLCARGNDKGGVMPVFRDEDFEHKYNSGACPGGATPLPLTSAPADTSVAASALTVEENSAAITSFGAAPAELASLNQAFVCSDLLTNQNSVRLHRLQNNIPYAVAVVAIDKRGNASKVTEAALASPTPTRDFYTGYRAAGGAAEGGCSMGGPRRHSGAIGLMTAALGLLLTRRRRQERRS